jgi:hypothetical protein
MLVEVLFTHHRGVPLPERQMLSAEPLRGQIRTVLRDSRGGQVLVVELYSVKSSIDKPKATLRRVELSLISSSGLRLRGLERVGSAWVAQGWLCQLV